MRCGRYCSTGNSRISWVWCSWITEISTIHLIISVSSTKEINFVKCNAFSLWNVLLPRCLMTTFGRRNFRVFVFFGYFRENKSRQKDTDIQISYGHFFCTNGVRFREIRIKSIINAMYSTNNGFYIQKILFKFFLFFFIEPGASYIVSVRLYYSSADVENITKVVSTIPTLPTQSPGNNWLIVLIVY